MANLLRSSHYFGLLQFEPFLFLSDRRFHRRAKKLRRVKGIGWPSLVRRLSKVKAVSAAWSRTNVPRPGGV